MTSINNLSWIFIYSVVFVILRNSYVNLPWRSVNIWFEFLIITLWCRSCLVPSIRNRLHRTILIISVTLILLNTVIHPRVKLWNFVNFFHKLINKWLFLIILGVKELWWINNVMLVNWHSSALNFYWHLRVCGVKMVITKWVIWFYLVLQAKSWELNCRPSL